jgi:hypothetical protein
MSKRGQNPSVPVGAFCKERRICLSCYRPWTERDTTRCVKCNHAHRVSEITFAPELRVVPQSQRCVRGTRNPRPLLTSALSAKIATLATNDPTNEGVRMCLRRRSTKGSPCVQVPPSNLPPQSGQLFLSIRHENVLPGGHRSDSRTSRAHHEIARKSLGSDNEHRFQNSKKREIYNLTPHKNFE